MAWYDPPPGTPDFPPVLNGGKRNHYLPQFYLDRWTDGEGLVYVYDRTKDLIRRQPPVNTTVQGHLYTLKDGEGRDRFEVEVMMSDIEGKTAPVIEKLVQGKGITDEERQVLSVFVGLAAFRTPEMFANVSQMNSDMVTMLMRKLMDDPEHVVQDLASKAGKPVTKELMEEAEGLVKFVQGGQYDVETHPQWALSMSVMMGLNIAPYLERRTWTVVEAPERSSFIASDCPVALVSTVDRPNRLFGGTGFGSPDAAIFFPLGPKHVLLMEGVNLGLAYHACDKDFVRRVNQMLTKQCRRFLVSGSNRLLLSLKQATGIAGKPWQPRMRLRSAFE